MFYNCALSVIKEKFKLALQIINRLYTEEEQNCQIFRGVGYMGKVSKVLLLLKDMIYESTSPLEIIRFAKYYRNKGLEVIVVLWGPMGIILGKKNKVGRMRYDEEIMECLDIGINFKCCDLAANLIGLDKSELIEGIELVESFVVADLLITYQEEGQLIFSL
jgi:intracellular sulfur oxidation DsrE/DsrF family protein